jgi:hypothetical protein
MTKDIDFTKINAVSVADKLYGTGDNMKWPGPAMTDTMEQYKNTCYGIIARFNGYDQTANLEQMKLTEAGRKCYEGVVRQYEKYGKHPYKKKIDQIIIPFYPQNFKNAYLQTGDIPSAYKKCLRMSQNDQQRNQCLLDKMALENTLPKKSAPVNKSAPPPVNKSSPPVNKSIPPECKKCNTFSLVAWVILIVILLTVILLKVFKKI